MELIAALTIVLFFVFLNEVRVALTGKENVSSEIFMMISSVVAAFLFSMVLSA
jgi:hypothetical protein